VKRGCGRIWVPTLKRLEIPHVGLHALRHSAAARMISAGASAKAIQTVLGHASVAFTLTVYGHMFDSDLDALADRLDQPHSPLARHIDGTDAVPRLKAIDGSQV
jgi:integrase